MKINLSRFFSERAKSQKGASLVEYGLLVGLIVVGLIGSVKASDIK